MYRFRSYNHKFNTIIPYIYHSASTIQGIRHAYTFRTRFTPQLRVCKKSHISWDSSTSPSIFAIVAQYGLARTSMYERCYG